MAVDQKAKSELTPLSEQLIGFGERQMQGRASTKSTMALMARADLPFRAGEWFVLRGIAAVVVAALVLFLFRGSEPVLLLLGGGVGAVVGLVLPMLVLRLLAGRRAAAFEAVLPDVLTLVSTSLRSGFGLAQALDAVARDAAEPAAKEFSRALAEARIGTDISDALEHMAARMNSTSMRWAVMAIRIQREVGGNLADTLHTTATTLKERESLGRQVRALSAEGRLSAYILVALPIGIFIYMLYGNYAYISLLWQEPLGIAMLVGGVVMMGLGMLWMNKIVKIEV
ncbi:type II secretion system F family protein [Terrabacter sp. BE26]|uniref:type II secretion system F family protein n=1 Tax=Terrabacter sp. BE26 TaxID=2898152 RepID=UPI0035BE6D04